MEDLNGLQNNVPRYRNRKFDLQFIHMVLKEIAEGLPLLAAGSKYNLPLDLIRAWNRKYAQLDLPVLRRVLSMQEKRTLLRSVIAGKFSIREAAINYQVGESSIHAWIKQYRGENEELCYPNQQQLNKKKIEQQHDSTSEQVRKLQQQLADAHLKIAALNTLIDVAEKQLKVDIRKKPGAKQS